MFALVFLSGCAQVLQSGLDPLSLRSQENEDSIALPSTVPLWVVGYRIGDGQRFSGATELSPNGEARPLVVDLANRRTRCDGLMEPAAESAPGHPKDALAHFTCS